LAQHIGIIAVSPEGSALCYTQIAKRASQVSDPARRPLITLHNLPFATYLEAIHAGNWEMVGTMLRWSAETLKAAGVDFCILPDNVAHYAVHFAERPELPPWLSMIDLVCQKVCEDRRRCVGVIGTKLVMNGSVYQSLLGLHGVKVLAPKEDEAEALDRIIFGELVRGDVQKQSRDRLFGAIDRLAERGCEGVILGSTETPLLLGSRKIALPTYNPVELLVEGAMKRAGGGEGCGVAPGS